MIYRIRLQHCLYTLLFVVLSLSIQAQSGDTLRVLFVGNSFTYFYNVPQTVQAMAKDQGVPMIIRQSTAGGATWQQHWDGEKNLKTRDLITDHDWDIVVLQNHSRSTIDHLDRFKDYGHRFDQLIRSNGATPLLYMTWGYESNPLMITPIAKGYSDLGTAIKADVVPVGLLFDLVRDARPDIDMFSDDKHQSMNGSYLIALAFYKYLSGRAVADIPPRIATIDQDGEKTYLMIIHPLDAGFMQWVVDESNVGKE